MTKAKWKTKKPEDVCEVMNGGTPKTGTQTFITTQRKKLGELFSFKNGRAFKKEEWSTTGLPIIRIQNLNNLDAPFNYFNGEYENDVLVESGDLLFSWSGTVGTSFGSHLWDREPGVLNQHIYKITFKSDVIKSYAFYALRYITAEIEKSVSGAVGLTHITKEKLIEFTIPVPPLPEQQRIVAILDKAFETIAATKANAEKNLKNARELFDSYLNQVFTQRGEEWTENCLGEMATFRNGINFTKASKGDPIKILGVKDFQNDYWAPIDDLDSIIPDGEVPDADTIQQNDLVFVRSNGNPALIGRCLLIGETPERTTHSGFTIKARLNTSDVVPTFLCHFLKSSLVRQEMIDGGNGVNIKSLNQGTLSRLRIPFPSRSTQTEIVGQIEALQEQTQHLESLYQQKLTALEELKKSIFHQAFSGEL